MKSYDDMPEDEPRGCLLPVLAVIVLLDCVALGACSSSPPKYHATVVRPSDGKTVLVIAGTYDPGQSWAQRNLGPIGGILSGLGMVLQSLLPAAAP